MAVPRFAPTRTGDLIVRPVRQTDVDALWQRRNDPTTAEFQSWALPYLRDQAQRLVSTMVDLDGVAPVDDWFQLAVDDARIGEPLGDLAVRLTFDARCAEIGWTVAPAARGRGVATDAAALLAHWLFDIVGVSRVSADMHPDNVASARVAERIGMVFEGLSRNSYWVGDDNTDTMHYAMTPDMWRRWNARSRVAPEDVRLVEIGGTRIDAVCSLATHRSQERLVSPVAKWFGVVVAPDRGDGAPRRPWLRAIEADGELVGALLMSTPTDERREAYLWRLMVDRMHQRRRIGRRTLDLAVEQARDWRAETLVASWNDLPGTAGPMYVEHGFVVTAVDADDEIEARFTL